MISTLQNLLDDFINKWNSPVAELSIYHKGNNYYFNSWEYKKYRYDIASMTKCIVSTITLEQVSKWNICLTQNIWEKVPYLNKYMLSVKDILRHKTWLDIIKKFDKSIEYSVNEINSLIKNIENIVVSDNKVYSNLNYIYLWDFLERIMWYKLDIIVDNFAKKNSLSFTYNPTNKLIDSNSISPTTHSPWIVHDPSTRYLGWISWAAGLFSLHEDLYKFWIMWLNNDFNIEKDLFISELKWDINEEYWMCWRKWIYSSEFVEFSWHTWPSIFISKIYSTVIALNCNICYLWSNEFKRSNYKKFKRELVNLVIENLIKNPNFR